jgi:hypothetical protein
MSRPRSTLWLACSVWVIAAMTIALVAGITAVCGRGAARDALDLTFPPRPHVTDFAVVTANNLALAGGLLLATRRPCRRFDVLIALGSVINVTLAGLALGGYGTRLLEHAAVYATCELVAFSLAIGTYINARIGRQPATVRGAIIIAPLVVASAALETIAAVRL